MLLPPLLQPRPSIENPAPEDAVVDLLSDFLCAEFLGLVPSYETPHHQVRSVDGIEARCSFHHSQRCAASPSTAFHTQDT